MDFVAVNATREEKRRWLLSPLDRALDVACIGILGIIAASFYSKGAVIGVAIAFFVAVAGCILLAIERIASVTRNY